MALAPHTVLLISREDAEQRMRQRIDLAKTVLGAAIMLVEPATGFSCLSCGYCRSSWCTLPIAPQRTYADRASRKYASAILSNPRAA